RHLPPFTPRRSSDLPDAIARAIAQVDDLEHLVDPPGGAVAVERGQELEVRAPAQIRIEARRLDESRHALQRSHAELRVAPEEARSEEHTSELQSRVD